MKIIIRPWRIDDAYALSAVANNRNISIHLRDRFPFPYKLEDAQDWTAQQEKMSEPVNFCIEVDGAVGGGTGFTLGEDIYRFSAEIGYYVAEPLWGHGIATYTVNWLVEYLFERLPIVRVAAEVFAHNHASMRVLEKNGFYLESERRMAVFKDGIFLDDTVWVRLQEKKKTL